MSLLKFSDKISSSISPAKNSKCRNFLASVLSPRHSKNYTGRKKIIKQQESPCIENERIGVSKILEPLEDPVYSTIKDLNLKDDNLIESDIESSLSANNSDLHHESSKNIIFSNPGQSFELTSVSGAKPLYATVIKKKRNIKIDSDASKKFDSPVQKHTESNRNEVRGIYEEEDTDSDIHGSMLSCGDNLHKNFQDERLNMKLKDPEITSVKTLMKDHKEEIKLLQQRIKEISEENRLLHKHVETVMKDEKWKQDTLHSQLQLKITKLEADTHMEVKSLSDRIQTLVKERQLMADQIHVLHQEKKALQAEFSAVCEKNKTMLSPHILEKASREHEMLLNEVKKTYKKEIVKLQQEYDLLMESKTSLLVETQDLKDKVNLLKKRNVALESSQEELLLEKNRLQLQLEEAKRIEHEAQNLLLSLLKVTETISIERDILLNKAAYQDHQQKQIQTTVIDYSLNIGRLQEHISNLSKEKSDELLKLKVGKTHQDENLKQLYGKQLDQLRSKILNQNNTISELENEKNKLELQLDSIWQATCGGKQKLMEQVNRSFLNV